jgi:hypothetical protein
MPTAAAVATSPFTYQQQVYQHPGKRWEIEVSSQDMPHDKAGVWAKFLDDLQGQVGTFTFNITAYCPTVAPAPGAVTFRLADSEVSWEADKLHNTYRFAFRAVQAL